MLKFLTVFIALLSGTAVAQQPPVEFTAEQDHQHMMDLLGIKALRRGPSGNDSAPNHANYDEALANPYPDLPDVLTLKNGTKVTTRDQWWTRHRLDKGDHRLVQSWTAAPAGCLGRAACLGVGRRPRTRLSRDRSGGGCHSRGHRRRVALWQSRPRGACLRAPVRHGAHRLVGQGWRDAASSQLG